MNTTILDPQTYADPQVSYVETQVSIPAENVRVGDIMDGVRVSSVKSGSKWTYLRDDTNKVLAEVQNREEVTVTRQEPTADFSAEQYRMRANRTMAEKVASRHGSLKAVQSKLNQDLDKNAFVDTDMLARLLQEQAHLKVLDEFVQVASRAQDGEDLVDVMREFADYLTHRLVRENRHKAITRSNNMLSNLLEDVEKEAMAEFIEKSRWVF